MDGSDAFTYLVEQKVLVCRQHKYAVPPRWIAAHLQTSHTDNSSRRRRGWRAQTQQIQRTLITQYNLIDPQDYPWPTAGPSPALPILPVRGGFKCTLCVTVTGSETSMKNHFATHHRGTRGRGVKASPSRLWTEVACQRLFVSGPSSRYFEVQLPSSTPPSKRSSQSRPQTIESTLGAEINSLLEETEHIRQETENTIPSAAGTGQVSPWLEMTRWPRHLGGLCFSQLGRLVQSPLPTEVDLIRLGESLDRIIQAGKQSIDQDKINAFDQTRINSFIKQRRATDRPLLVKLQKGTWIRYTGTWKRLLYLVFRLTQPQYAPSYPIHR